MPLQLPPDRSQPRQGHQDHDPLALLDGVPLSEDEAGYVAAARAANTLRGYRSDSCEFTGWSIQHGPSRTRKLH